MRRLLPLLALLLATALAARAGSPFEGRWAMDRGPAADFEVKGSRLSASWPAAQGARVLLDAEIDGTGRAATGVYRMVRLPAGDTLERWKASLRLGAGDNSITMDLVRVPQGTGQLQYVFRRVGPARLTPQQKLEAILARYRTRIPPGLVGNGPANNVRSWFDAQCKPFTCGGYQRQVLELLDGLKFSQDPADRALMDDWDFGPIQVFHGGHQAVVLYPKGTDWTRTGIVLDPWPRQKPESFTIANWSNLVGLGAVGAPGSSPEPSRTYRQSPYYPLLGGDYLDPSLRTLTEEEKTFKRGLPPEEATRLDALSVREQRAQIQAMREAPAGRAATHCPLNPWLVDSAGRVTGFPSGRFRGEIPGVVAQRLRLADGTWWTELRWTGPGALTLVLEPAGSGPALVTTWTPGRAWQYPLEVRPGAEGRLPLQPAGAALSVGGRTVPADPFTAADAASLARRLEAQPPGSTAGPSGPTAPAGPGRDRLGSVWTVQEIGRWTGVWTRRAGTKTFDAVWRSVDGAVVRDVLVVESVQGNRVVLYRQGKKGRYTGTLSADGTRIEGTTSWYAPGWKWSATIRP